MEERKAATNLKEEIENQESVLEFLLCLQKSKREDADKLHNTVCLLSSDIEEALNHQEIALNKGSSHAELDKSEHFEVGQCNQSLLCPVTQEDSSSSGSRKRFRSELQNYSEEVDDAIFSEMPVSKTMPELQKSVLLKSSRLMKNFKKFEAAYLSTRCRLMKPAGRFENHGDPITSTGSGLFTKTEGSTVESITSKEVHSKRMQNEWINPFLEGMSKYLSFSKLRVRADLKQGDLLSTSNLVCSLGFDRDKHFFATAGANRKIKIFECDMILNENQDLHYPVVEMKSRSRVSCISWNTYIKSQIASSDFDGAIQVFCH